MAATIVTMRMDEQLKAQLQKLVSNLGYLVPCINYPPVNESKNTFIKETSSMAVFFCIPSCLSLNLCYDINI